MPQQAYYERMVALAGVCQSALLVSQIARTGNIDADLLKVSLASIVNTEPQSAEDVFAGVANIKVGANTLLQHLDPKQKPKNMDVLRYTIGLLALQKRLHKSKGAFDALATRIDQSKRQLEHFDLTDPHMISKLASIYTDIVSPVGQRIQIAGSATYLEPKANQDKIRAILLAGVRAAVLWQQTGGNRLQFLLSRKKMLDATQFIIAQ